MRTLRLSLHKAHIGLRWWKRARVSERRGGEQYRVRSAKERSERVERRKEGRGWVNRGDFLTMHYVGRVMNDRQVRFPWEREEKGES
jgi:hypothetical protein